MLGFKSSRKFLKRLFIWDLIEKTLEWLNTTTGTSSSGESEGTGSEQPSCQEFITNVSKINRLSKIGKDEKVKNLKISQGTVLKFIFVGYVVLSDWIEVSCSVVVVLCVLCCLPYF